MIMAVSGACASGKTTYMQKLKALNPDKIILYDEVIRNKVTNIDLIRQDQVAYFELQKQIIKEKHDQELCAQKTYDDSYLCVFDRSLADSLFYYTHYIDVGHFDEELQYEYNQFLDQILTWARYSFKNIYSNVVLFYPIDKIDVIDPMRPKTTSGTQYKEFNIIRLFTMALDTMNKVSMTDATYPPIGMLRDIGFMK